MSTNETGVCVIIAAFNAQKTIGRAVRSALQQDHVSEVVVVDDASRDGTAEVARGLDDGTHRLSVVALAENKGPSAARNTALEHSRAPYVCTLDADDYFLPGRVSRLLDIDDKTWDMLADDILIVPEDQQHIEFSVMDSGSPRRCKTLKLESFVKSNISRPRRPRHEFGFFKPIIKRSFLQQHGLRYDERLRLGEDYALYTQALITGARFCLANACGYVAIERNDSISSVHSATDLEKIAAFDAACLRNELSLNDGERKALAAHRMATIRKYNYRIVLDQRRDRGLLAALAVLATMPASIPYIASETIRARTTRLFGQKGHRDDKASMRGFRFLVGMPETKLTLSGTE